MEKKLIYDSSIEKYNIPFITLKLLTNNDPLSARKTGIFTIEDLVSIKKYVSFALSLPDTVEKIKYHFYYSEKIPQEIDINKIQHLFLEIRKHAYSWNKIEYYVKQQSIDLELTGRTITQTGQKILQYIHQMPIMEKISLTPVEITTNHMMLRYLSSIKLASDDEQIKTELISILNYIRKIIYEQSQKTNKVKSMVSHFRIKIIGGVSEDHQQIESLMFECRAIKRIIKKINSSKKFIDIENKIELKKEEIPQLNDEYKHFVRLSFTGLAGGVIGIIITGSIFGKEAEKVRKRRNKLLDEILSLTNILNDRVEIEKSINHIIYHFHTLDNNFIDASLAIDHLDYMWQIISTEINDSIEQLKTLDTAMKLTLFSIQFRRIINAWESVIVQSENLISIFDTAIKISNEE